MIGIIDLGLSNLKSIQNAVKSLGHDTIILRENNSKDVKKISNMILPGVGSYLNLSNNLAMCVELKKELDIHVRAGKPFLGICLGMQFLSSEGYEHGKSKGLNLIPGKVIKIKTKDNLKIPHVGWNELNILHHNEIFKNIETKTNLYFVHSYYYIPESQDHVIAETIYGLKIPAVINKENIYGFQFHPEKSSNNGLQMLDNFCSI